MKRKRKGYGISVYQHKCSYTPKTFNPDSKVYWYICLKVWKGKVQRTRSLAPLKDALCFFYPDALSNMVSGIKNLRQLKKRVRSHPICSSCPILDECALLKLVEEIKVLSKELRVRLSDKEVLRALGRYSRRIRHRKRVSTFKMLNTIEIERLARAESTDVAIAYTLTTISLVIAMSLMALTHQIRVNHGFHH